MEFKEPTFKEIPREKASIETQNSNESKKIIEKAKKERLSVGKVLFQRLKSLLFNAIPVAGSIKMGKEIYKSKNIRGKEIFARDKIVRGVVISSNLIFYILLGFRLGSEDSEVNKEIHLLMLELTSFATWLTIAQESIEGKRDVQEVIKEKFKLDFPQFLKNVRQFAEKYDTESLKEPLSICEKTIEEYGYDNIGNLIVRANDKKLDDNK